MFAVGLLSLAQDRVWPSRVSKLREAGLNLLEGSVLSLHFEEGAEAQRREVTSPR